MEGLLDSGSPRRGSLSSLQRQSSGSSHNFRSSPGANSSNSSSNNNPTNINNLSKELDKFTRYFIIKTVQVVVQSRIMSGSSGICSSKNNKSAKTECKPSGNDWFNINISDIAEISDKTKAIIDSDCFTVKSNWRICCEISIRTNDGNKVVLEHWIISNKAKQALSVVTNTQQGSPKSVHSNSHLSPVQLTTSNTNGSNSSANAINTTPPSTRLRTATFSNTMRTRLNSIDDCSGYDDDDDDSVNKLLVDTAPTSAANNNNNNNINNDKNIDIKSSTSCYSLSNSPANRLGNQITTSPSINSLNNNHAMDQSFNNSNSALSNNSQQQGSKTSSSSIYTIYNKMSLLLKTLMTTTHIVPAYRLASNRATSQVDSYVICYRVYTCSSTNNSTRINSQLTNRGSIEDICYNLGADSPNKRSTSSSNVSFGSLNIRDFVELEELEHFSPITKLGVIKTDINELDVSVCYRTDVANSSQLFKSPRSRDLFSKIKDEDCIIAAKQLLAGNDQHLPNQKCHEFDVANNSEADRHQNPLSFIDKPLRPAFANTESDNETNKTPNPELELIESVFDNLLKINDQSEDDRSNGKNHRASNANQSEPIQVPSTTKMTNKKRELYPNLSCNSTPKSIDSFVLIEINPPFASEEQNGINSFFNGPSPTFNHGFDSLKDIDELTNQFADIEANASQLDEFVDNICISEEEEEEEEEGEEEENNN